MNRASDRNPFCTAPETGRELREGMMWLQSYKPSQGKYTKVQTEICQKFVF